MCTGKETRISTIWNKKQKADYFLDVELRPPGVEACSGSWLTRQVGKEQPSPRLKNPELVSYIEKKCFQELFGIFSKVNTTISYFNKLTPSNPVHPD